MIITARNIATIVRVARDLGNFNLSNLSAKGSRKYAMMMAVTNGNNIALTECKNQQNAAIDNSKKIILSLKAIINFS